MQEEIDKRKFIEDMFNRVDLKKVLEPTIKRIIEQEYYNELIDELWIVK